MQHESPCATCPFRRTVEPGELGGGTTQTFVGQTEAGFLIYCHECIDYSDPQWKEKASVPGAMNQCAGAAIFRSNIDRVKQSELILSLPADTGPVFASHAEFVSHHEGLTPAGAEQFLKHWTPKRCVEEEYRRAGVKVTLVPKK